MMGLPRLSPSRMAVLAGVSMAVFASMAVPAAAAVSEFTVESAGADGVTLIWRCLASGDGAWAVRRTAVALPPGATASAVLEVLGENPAPPAAAAMAAAGDPPGLSLGSPSRFRDVTVAAVSLNPVRAAAGRPTSLLTRARLRIVFRRNPAARSAFAPPPTGPAEAFLQSWLVNYEQSRSLRAADAGRAGSPLGKASAGPGPAAGLAKERLMIYTASDNIEVLDFEALKQAGLPLERINPRYMHLYRDGVEKPLYIQGEDDGHWNPGDYLEFIGQRAAGQTTYNNFYTTTSAFMLTWEGSRAGLRAPAVPTTRPGGAADSGKDAKDVKVAKPFRVFAHRELDREILRISSTSQEDVADLGAHVREAELTDFWYWDHERVEKDAVGIPFDLGFTPAAEAGPGAPTLRMRVNLKGVTNHPNADPDHHVKFILNGKDISLVGGVVNDAIWEGQDSYTWVSAPLKPDAEILKAKGNVLTIQKVNDLKTGDGRLVENQDAYLNWIELEFPATYAVSDDNLRFSNDFADSTGLTAFTLKGFTHPAISLWDTAGRKLVGYSPTAQGAGSYSIRFLDSLVGPTNYIASGLGSRERPAVRLDTLEELLHPSEGADYLVITHRDLLGSALDSLLAFRRAQGLRCRVVTADHIYQAFGDGSMDPAAIRAFTAYAYRNWPRPAPAYLVLVGDVSVWFDKILSPFQRTLVPTHLVNITGWGVAADDDYFAKVSGDDDVADLFVGRIHVITREDLSRVVRKTLALEKARPQGHWSNKAFLLGGFEASFTEMNDNLQAIAVANDRQFSRIDLATTSPYYKNRANRGAFFDQMDSAFNLVSFVGHGGGAIWSDDGILTLKQLYDGSLRSDFPIPLVASITCLTGYFEDINAPSLGEEMLRLDRTGAAAFYGASGYISNLAGAALSAEVMRATATGAARTAGAAINQAETMVKLRTGDAFLPIMAEFNLLGDPALTINYPSPLGELQLAPSTLAGTSALDIKGRGLSPDGEGVLTLYVGDSAVSSSSVKIAGGAFHAQNTLPDPAGGGAGLGRGGKALLDYWDGKQSHTAAAPFSFLDWLVDSVAIAPAEAAPGDSVSLRFRLSTAYPRVGLVGGIASYVVGGEQAPLFPGDNQAPMQTGDGIHFESAFRVAVAPPGNPTPHPRLHVAFRLSLQTLGADSLPNGSVINVDSRTYSLPLLDLARLALHQTPFRISVQTEGGVWVAFTNKGLGEAEGFKLKLSRNVEAAEPVVTTLAYSGKLPFGAVDSLFFTLADSMLDGKRLRAELIPARAGELAPEGQTHDTVFHVATRLIAGPADTLIADSGRIFVTLAGGTSSRRVFLEKTTVTKLPAHLSPPARDSLTGAPGTLPMDAWLLQSESAASLVIGNREPGALSKAASASASPYWHYQDDASQAWVKLDTVTSLAAAVFRPGVYARLINNDATAPSIQLTSRGQTLLPDDYVPLHTPVNILFRDGAGIDLLLHPPVLISRHQSIDSAGSTREINPPFPLMARLAFLPRHKSPRDSLEITAHDVSGNVVSKVVAYRLGEDLHIQNLGSYPNPFADTAVFVYSLTDYCEKVDLKIYSRAGRLVRSLQEKNVVGYREVPWDGRSNAGHDIANGLYFLKVTAQTGDKESSRIFKLFKKKRK